jgi:hypothetical protein
LAKRKWINTGAAKKCRPVAVDRNEYAYLSVEPLIERLDESGRRLFNRTETEVVMVLSEPHHFNGEEWVVNSRDPRHESATMDLRRRIELKR